MSQENREVVRRHTAAFLYRLGRFGFLGLLGSDGTGVIWVFPAAGCSEPFLRSTFKVTTPDRRPLQRGAGGGDGRHPHELPISSSSLR